MVSTLVDVLCGNVSRLVCDILNVSHANLGNIRIGRNAVSGHHHTACALGGRLCRCLTHANRLLDIHTRKQVCRATLRNVELNRANLTTKLFLDNGLEHLARTRKVLVSEHVGNAALLTLANVSAVSKVNTLRDCHNNVGLLTQLCLYVLKELLHREVALGKIQQVGLNTVHHSADGRRSRQPACVSTHDLHNRNGGLCIDRAVTNDLGHGNGNVLSRRAEAGGVIGAHQVIINGLGNADKAHLIVVDLGILGELCHRIHRVITADIEEITNVVLAEQREDLLVVILISLYLGKLFTARAESRRRRVFKQVDVLGLRKALVQIDKSLLQKALHTVSHAVQRVTLAVSKKSANNACKRRIDCGSRTARLSNDSISIQKFLCHSLFSKLL